MPLTLRKDGGWGWMVAWGAFINGFIVDGIRNSCGILYLEFLREFQKGKGVTSWVWSLMFGVSTLYGPVASVLVNRFGCRAVVVAGSLVGTVGFVASVFTSSVYHLYFTVGVLGGVGIAMITLPSDVIIVHYFEKRRAFAFGVATVGSGVGSIVFSPLLKWLIDLYGWRGALVIEGGITLNGVVSGFFMRPFPRSVEAESSELQEITEEEHSSMIPDSQIDRKIHDEDSKRTKKNNRRFSLKTELLKDAKFLILCLSFICLMLGLNIPFMYLPDLVVSAGHTRGQAAWLLSIIGISGTVFRPLAGWLADTRLVRPHTTVMYAVALVTMGIAMAALLASNHYAVLVVCCAVLGISIGTFAVLVSVVVSNVFDEAVFADAMGLLMMATFIPSMLGAPIAGWLFDAFGSYVVPFLVASAEVIFGGLVLLLIPFSKRLRPTKESSATHK